MAIATTNNITVNADAITAGESQIEKWAEDIRTGRSDLGTISRLMNLSKLEFARLQALLASNNQLGDSQKEGTQSAVR